jgi:alkylation response protein AidB-like acyl-CoA dehydrogenase
VSEPRSTSVKTHDEGTTPDERATQINLLRESAAEFVRRNTDFKKYRARREQSPGFDAAHVRQMAELGWFGILVPQAQGGLGLGLAELAVVVQALGKGLLAEPIVAATVLAGRVLARAPQSAIRDQLLSALADASALPSLAWQEGMGALDPADINTQARVSEQGVRLNGSKRLVVGAAGASGFLVSARTGHDRRSETETENEIENRLNPAHQLGLYWVPTKTHGLSISFEWRADGTPVGVLKLEDVGIPAEYVLAQPGAATRANLEWAIDEAAVLVGAELLGVMEAALQMALSYLRTRVQFGKPIGSFQALQHKTTDLYVQQELSRAVLAEALAVLDPASSDHAVDPLERALVASRFKSRCSDAGLRVTREVIQLHGAIGFTDEYDAGLYLKRALVLSAWLGNASAHRRRFAALSPDLLGA